MTSMNTLRHKELRYEKMLFRAYRKDWQIKIFIGQVPLLCVYPVVPLIHIS